jgi:hypothetical protein
MTLLFLPIDIQVDKINFTRTPDLKKVPAQIFQPPWWDSAILDKSSLAQFNHIIKQLPYDKISIVMHKFQNAPVGSHLDVYPSMKIGAEELSNINENEPCGYRLVLNGKDDVLEIFDGVDWLTPKLPTVPCCYLIDSTRLRHRVKDDPGREVLYFRGIINKDRNQELIEKSLKVYKDHAVYSK